MGKNVELTIGFVLSSVAVLGIISLNFFIGTVSSSLVSNLFTFGIPLFIILSIPFSISGIKKAVKGSKDDRNTLFWATVIVNSLVGAYILYAIYLVLLALW